MARSTTTHQWRRFILLTPFSAFGNASRTQWRATCSNLRYQKLADGEGSNLLWALLVRHCFMDSSVAGWERCERSLVIEITPFVLIKKGIVLVVPKPCYSTWKGYVPPLVFLERQWLCVFLLGIIHTFQSAAWLLQLSRYNAVDQVLELMYMERWLWLFLLDKDLID